MSLLMTQLIGLAIILSKVPAHMLTSLWAETEVMDLDPIVAVVRGWIMDETNRRGLAVDYSKRPAKFNQSSTENRSPTED